MLPMFALCIIVLTKIRANELEPRIGTGSEMSGDERQTGTRGHTHERAA